MKGSYLATRGLAIITLILGASLSQAQQANIREYQQAFATYDFSDPDPVAKMGKIYPYFRFDGYQHVASEKNWKIVELENDWIRVLIMPEQGGKIIGAIEKSTGYEFIYYNKVVKFRDIAMRGAWTSGGIEYNFGSIGHAPSTATPVDYHTTTNPDGSVSCWLGAMDLSSRTEWRVEVRLPADKAWFETHAFWYNPTDLATSKYHWMNAAADATDALIYYWPGQYYIGHDGEVEDWPVLKDGRNLSVYPNNNYGSDHSYHVIGQYTDFFGGYYSDKDFGFGHWSDYAEKPGKKMWIWALSPQGAIWKDLLTDPGNNQYTEIQTGLLFNQAASGSTMTPFKHLEFESMNTERFSERWFPVIGTGGIVEIGEEGVLGRGETRDAIRESLGEREMGREVRFMALEEVKGEMEVTLEGGERVSFMLNLKPLEKIERSFEKDVVAVSLGAKLFWSLRDDEQRKSDRPVVKPDFNWNSLQGKYYRALEWSRQRDYAQASKGFEDCLSEDPNYIPALNGLAREYIRVMKYEQALELLKRVLSIDTYEPEANYLYGVCRGRQGDGETARRGDGETGRYQAKEAFGVALRSMEYRSAAYAQLADIAIAEHDFDKALRYARSALDYNRYNMNALGFEVVALRLLRRTTEGTERVRAWLGIDPLSHQARYEAGLLGLPVKMSPQNEFAEQSYLELAIRYHQLGLNEDALKVLALAPDHPMVNYWTAYLSDSPSILQERALIHSTDLVFPWRPETLTALEWAEEKTPAWQNRYYMGLIHWNMQHLSKATDLFRSCGDEPQNWAFYLSRARLFTDLDPELVIHDLQRALDLGQDQWRTWLAKADYFMVHGAYPEALSILRKAHTRFSDNFIVAFARAKAELYNHEYDKCLEILSDLVILPNEGARAGHDVFRKAHILSGLERFRKNQLEKAVQHYDQARLWPENLGVGRPYVSDERIEDYLTAIAYLQADKMEEAAGFLTRVIRFTEDQSGAYNSHYLLYLLSLRLMNHETKADQLMQQWVKKHPKDATMNWARLVYAGEAEQAEEAARMISGSSEGTPWDPGRGDAAFPMVYEVVRQVKVR